MKSKKFHLDCWKVMAILIMLILAIVLLYPLLMIGVNSFLNEEGRFSLTNYIDFISLEYYTSALKNSFVVCIAATIIATIVGVPVAYISTRYAIKGKKILDMIVILSMISPPFIGAYSWILLFGRNGVITNLLNGIGIHMPSIYGFGGMVLVFTVKFFPLIYLYVSGALGSIDVSLEEASENLGMSKIKRIFTVTLPLILPTITAAMLMVFMAALADFGTPMLIGEGYKVLPVLIYQQYLSETGGNASMASTLSVVIVLCALVVLIIQKVVINRKNYTMSMLRPPKAEKLTKGKCALATFACFLVGFIGILPQLTVFVTSFLKTSGPMFVKGFTLDSYKQAMEKMGSAIVHTFAYSTVAIVIMIAAGILIAYLSVRKRSKLNTVLDTLVMFPYVIPGAVLGIALLLAFGKGPLILTGTPVILIMAYVIRKLPYTIRSSSAILYQIDSSIEEASINLGVSPIKTFFKTTAILMIPGVFSGAVMSWINTINELSSSVMLYTSKTMTISVAIYTEVLKNNYGTAAALAVILSLASMITVLLFTKLSGGRSLTL